MSLTSDKTTTTEWRLLKVERHADRTVERMTVGIQINRTRLIVACKEGLRIESGSIELSAYELDGRERQAVFMASMGGSYSFADQTYVLTGGTMMFNNSRHRGWHIGTYMQNEVVQWAKTHIGQPGKIRPIRLVEDDARTKEDMTRRNRFYQQFGIRFIWSTDPTIKQGRAGQSDPALTIEDVHTVAVASGVTAYELQAAIHDANRRAFRGEEAASEAEKARVATRNTKDQELASLGIIQRCLLVATAVLFVALILALRFR